ncbi:MAG: radical SAM protein [Parcubacteria group bacterium]
MMIEALARIYSNMLMRPRTAQIAITNRCNFNCPMCQRNDLRVGIKDIDLFLFEKILAKLDGVKNVVLTGWGEPFLHPDLFRMIKLCKANGMNARLTTNGSILTDEKISALLESGLDAIAFSIERIAEKKESIGHAAGGQVSAVEKLIDARKKAKSLLKIYIQSVFGAENESDILEIVDFAVEKGIDRVRLTRLDVRFHDYSRPDLKAEKAIIKKIERKIKGTRIGLDFLPHAALDGFARQVFKMTMPLLGSAKYCLRLLGDVYINEDAKVTPCCALPNLVMGDIQNEELGAIWHGEKFKEFRKNQRKYCGKCDILSLERRG